MGGTFRMNALNLLSSGARRGLFESCPRSAESGTAFVPNELISALTSR